MKTINTLFLVTLVASTLVSCGDDQKNYDATGTFEADETIISSQANGEIMQLELEEGQRLSAGTVIGYVDSTQLHYKRLQLEAQMAAVAGSKPDVTRQLAVLREQLKTAHQERKRIKALVEGNVATQKQLDDMDAQIEYLNRQLDAQQTSLMSGVKSTDGNVQALIAQLAQIDDQIAKCRLVNPLTGTVLLKYAREHETTAFGKPLYKIADLSALTLRVYVSGNQLPDVQLGQSVTVRADDGGGAMKEYKGTVYWVSDEAEFTPKTVQTKEERANKVYAVKVRVPNDGYLKPGMYGEINF